MSVYTYKPKSFLSDYIDRIWCSNEADVYVKESNYPFLQSELIFHYGEFFSLTGERVSVIKTSNADIILSGLKTSPFVTEVSGRYSAIGFLLKPHCYGIIKHHIGFDELENITGYLHSLLLGSNNPDFDSIEKLLQKVFRSKGAGYLLNIFQDQVNHSYLRRGAIGKELHTMNISQKHFYNRFKRFVGLTPGEFIKLKQVNHAIELMKSKRELNLAEISYEAGFYDQAHFSRTFKSFCGITPNTFRRKQFESSKT